jgi:cytoskeletal protein CcmA (bactofilin family)
LTPLEYGLVMKQRNQINAFLGADTDFEGKLSFKGSVRIDGRFKGEILTDGTLIIGETAFLESNIRVSHIIISGEVRGNIIASDRIEINAPGKVFGNIETPTLLIAEGVVFEGSCTMQNIKEPKEKKVASIKDVVKEP